MFCSTTGDCVIILMMFNSSPMENMQHISLYYSCSRIELLRTIKVVEHNCLSSSTNLLFYHHIAQKNSFPPLSQSQITKLKHLSLISLTAERRVRPLLVPLIINNPQLFSLGTSLFSPIASARYAYNTRVRGSDH